MSKVTRPFVVLLAEDEESEAHLAKWAFEESQIPIDLHHVYDGREVLEFLHRQPPRFQDAPRPGLILLDLNMPRMGGLECLAAIKGEQALRDIPVVMLSTLCDKGDIAAATGLGAAEVITKPLDIGQFVESIRMLGERWISPVTLR